MSVHSYWQERPGKAEGTYQCPKCKRDLRPVIAGPTAKNAGKAFLSCSTYGEREGCDQLWCLLENAPRGSGGGGLSGFKRKAPEQVNAPPDHEQNRLAEVESSIAVLQSKVAALQLALTELKEQFTQFNEQ